MDLIKSLTEGQCGSQAPMVVLSNNFAQAKSFMLPENMPSFSSNGDLLTNEYLRHVSAESAAPNTFDMSAILQQCLSSSSSESVTSIHMNSKPTRHNPALLRKWYAEYERSISNGSGQSKYADVHSAAGHSTLPALMMNDVWGPIGVQPALQPIASQFFSPLQRQAPTSSSDTWASDFLNRFDSAAAASVTPTLTDSTDDSTASKFSESVNAEAWVNEFIAATVGDDIDYKETHNDAYDIFSRYEDEWNRMSGMATTTSTAGQYNFHTENPFVNEPNPLERAMEFFTEGNVADAVLCYEAALQRNPNDAETWCSLGLCHAENEQDGEAIVAFRRSVELDPLNRRTLLSSAVSLANEGADTAAMRHLDQWLHQFRVAANAPTASDNDAFTMSDTWAQELNDKFLATAASLDLSPARTAELYNALAIFYNLTHNYAKAVEAMRTAISIDQTDAVLWNRLGASLANDDRSPEAIGAYRKALELSPAYVRARYNLGVSCMNMNSFRDAIGHFLSALRLQKNQQNSEIWSKLRSCVLRSSSVHSFDNTSRWIGEALDAVEARDVDAMAGAYERALHAL